MILRELLVKLGLDVDAQSFAKGELFAKAIEKGLDAIVDAGKEFVESIVENVKGVVEYGDELNKAAQKTGIARNALQELRYVAELADVGTEGLTASINVLTRNMRAAKDGSEEHAKAFQKLGIRVTDTKGKLRGADEVITDVAKKLAKMPDGAEKTALAMQVFGRAGAQMIPLLNEGAEGIEELRQEARDLGLVMGDEAVKSSEELSDNLKRLSMISKGLWRQAIGPLIPLLNNLAKRFFEWRKANAAILRQRINAHIETIKKGIIALVNVVTFLVRNMDFFKAAIIGVIAVMGILHATAVGAAIASAAAWAIAALPFVAIGAAIAALLLIFDDLRVYQKGGKSLYGQFKAEIDKWREPNPNDPWWLAAIKQLVGFLQQAIEYTKQLDNLWQKLSVALPWAAKTDNTTDYLRQRFDKTQSSSVGSGVPFGPAPYAPMVPSSPTRGGAAVQQTYAPTYQIYQQPGQDSDVLAKMIDEKNQQFWNGKMEEAAAALGE